LGNHTEGAGDISRPLALPNARIRRDITAHSWAIGMVHVKRDMTSGWDADFFAEYFVARVFSEQEVVVIVSNRRIPGVQVRHSHKAFES